ncbi:S8 family serine peptidase [Catenuloplanes japonicus]|uniref:S8 family serine peptidase n=1 Tax=Catenuloplanes japonicus TaxID=33876 RepID=UPI00068E8BCB|nr:S8 family serine peptidase [Catenuloplanes japonicus]
MSRVPHLGRHRLTGAVVVTLVAALLGLGSAWPASAGVAADEYVLYYTVTSGQGSPENLGTIAERFLGDSGRSAELFNLNSGRKQPDGGALSDGNKLTPGWYIVLPWDAVGAGVQYGVLPTGAPAPATTPAKPGATPTKNGGGTNPGGTNNGGTNNGGGTPVPPSPGTSGSPSPAVAPPVSPRGPAEPSGKCITGTVASSPSNWAFVRLAPEQAWAASRGIGEMVAVVDSGVDGSKAQLSNKMSTGANIVTGEGRGDTDCLGTGTAMAGLIAAKQEGETFGGIAPDSVIMPVRVVTDGKTAEEADQAAAIQVAVSAGATVIALGGYVDPTLPSVTKAIESALSKQIIVVAGARTNGAALPADVITVGGVGQDGKLVEEYAADAVDVVAPGANISSLGAGSTKTFVGTGTQYAVAMVAGQAALVRSSHPDLSVTQVAHRIAVTADKMGEAQPDHRYGYGMINPEASVTKTLADETVPINSQNRAVGDVSGGDGVRIAFVLTVLAGLALSTLLVFRVMRSVNRARAEKDGSDPDQTTFSDGSPPASPAV